MMGVRRGLGIACSRLSRIAPLESRSLLRPSLSCLYFDLSWWRLIISSNATLSRGGTGCRPAQKKYGVCHCNAMSARRCAGFWMRSGRPLSCPVPARFLAASAIVRETFSVSREPVVRLATTVVKGFLGLFTSALITGMPLLCRVSIQYKSHLNHLGEGPWPLMLGLVQLCNTIHVVRRKISFF